VGHAVALFTGAVFTVGLMLVVIAGSELLTGNMALVPLALLRGKISMAASWRSWRWASTT
jgi:formate transporter